MTRLTPDIAALVGSRICHDLISPLGAIGNGLELMAMSPGQPDGPEMALINESVESANARIRFFRVAFGYASHGQAMAASEIRSILGDIGATGRIHYKWQGDGDCLRTEVRPAFLAILCLESALALGGVIEISQSANRWHLSGLGDRLHVDTTLWSDLDQPTAKADISPSRVQFALLPLVLADLGRPPIVEIGDTAVQISF